MKFKNCLRLKKKSYNLRKLTSYRSNLHKVLETIAIRLKKKSQINMNDPLTSPSYSAVHISSDSGKF